MANQGWNQAPKYTDTTYVTRPELRRILQTNQIDWPWREISLYRQTNSREFSLKNILNKKFTLTCTQALEARYGQFESTLNGLLAGFNRFPLGSDEKTKAIRECKFQMLKTVAELEGKTISDVTLKAMLSGMYRENNPDHVAVLGYRDALDELMLNPDDGYDENFLASMLCHLQGTEELISFYRLSDHRSIYTAPIAGMNTRFDEAKSELIEPMMDNLWSFLQNDHARPFVKALTALYFIHYIKPFSAHNDAIAALLAKKIVAAEMHLGESGILIPFEIVLKKSKTFDDIDQEIQASGDITYFILYAMNMLRTAIEALLDGFVALRRTAIKTEVNAVPEEEIAPQPVTPKVVEMAPSPAPVPVPVAAEMPPEPQEPAEKTPEPEPVKETDLSVPPVVEKAPVLSGNIAAHTPKVSLTDREIKDAAKYILETNPNVRKTQAFFFASHCVTGHYYTIQDYKKATRCAYETARTSMDNLAREGYYRKLQIKNKYVYTPIKQGEQKK